MVAGPTTKWTGSWMTNLKPLCPITNVWLKKSGIKHTVLELMPVFTVTLILGSNFMCLHCQWHSITCTVQISHLLQTHIWWLFAPFFLTNLQMSVPMILCMKTLKTFITHVISLSSMYFLMSFIGLQLVKYFSTDITVIHSFFCMIVFMYLAIWLSCKCFITVVTFSILLTSVCDEMGIKVSFLSKCAVTQSTLVFLQTWNENFQLGPIIHKNLN